MIRYLKDFVIFSVAVVVVGGIGWMDIRTGGVPNLTIFYLLPIAAVVILSGVWAGISIAVVSATVEAYSNFILGLAEGPILLMDGGFHLGVFILTVILLDQLFTRLTTVRRLEARRDHDISIARAVHHSVFSEVPPRYEKLEIAGRMVFARELGGDYYHFAEQQDGLFFCVADISGKSLSAALFSALLHQSVTDAIEHETDISRIVSRINRGIQHILPNNMFVTLFCAKLTSDEVQYVNAGHEPGLLHRYAEDAQVRLMNPYRFPVGFMPTLQIEIETVPLYYGDTVLIMTDGITDALRNEIDAYKELEKLMSANAHGSVDEILDEILRAATEPGTDPIDDILAICIKKIER